MDMDVLTKTVEKIELKNSISLEEINDLMLENAEKFPGKFKLKKGLMGKAINFDVFMQTQPKITIKDKIVTIRRVGNSTSVGIGNMPSMDFKDLKQRVNAVKDGGLGKAVSGGADYFSSVCDVMQDILKSYQ